MCTYQFELIGFIVSYLTCLVYGLMIGTDTLMQTKVYKICTKNSLPVISSITVTSPLHPWTNMS